MVKRKKAEKVFSSSGKQPKIKHIKTGKVFVADFKGSKGFRQIFTFNSAVQRKRFVVKSFKKSTFKQTSARSATGKDFANKKFNVRLSRIKSRKELRK